MQQFCFLFFFFWVWLLAADLCSSFLVRRSWYFCVLVVELPKQGLPLFFL
jgi:hypothetical protein